jgi:hypothetical protein
MEEEMEEEEQGSPDCQKEHFHVLQAAEPLCPLWTVTAAQ